MNDDSKKDETGDAESAKPTGLLEKIKATLANTPADRWEQGGEALDSSKRYQRAQETWEQLFCTDTKTGVLVLRCSTPVVSNFFAGGYNFVESSVPRYLVELRPRGWAPKMVLDPSFRGAQATAKQVQVLAEGDIARQLYNEVQVAVRQHQDSLRRDFNDSVERLAANIREQIQGTAAEDWESVEGEAGHTSYRGDVNGMTVTVGCSVRERSSAYSMTFGKYGLRWECRDMNLCKEIFTMVDESVRQASLEQLGKVLEDML